jgi:hypothetical protein
MIKLIDRLKALANLNHTVGPGTIAMVLRRNGIEPSPKRSRRTPWSTFAGITTRSGESWMLRIARNATDSQTGALRAKR